MCALNGHCVASWTYEFQLEGIRCLGSFRRKQAGLLRCSAVHLLLELGHEVLRKQRRSSISENELEAPAELLPAATQWTSALLTAPAMGLCMSSKPSSWIPLSPIFFATLSPYEESQGARIGTSARCGRVFRIALPDVTYVAAGRPSYGGHPTSGSGSKGRCMMLRAYRTADLECAPARGSERRPRRRGSSRLGCRPAAGCEVHGHSASRHFGCAFCLQTDIHVMNEMFAPPSQAILW